MTIAAVFEASESTLKVEDASVVEGDNGSVSMQFTVTRTP
jgi:hypothetical protein